MQHKLSEVNLAERTATCAICGPGKIRVRVRKGKAVAACKKHHNYLNKRAQKRTGTWNSGQRGYRKRLQSRCDRCGFNPEDVCQLDIHHVNGRTDPDTLQTLCANCHRLITKQEQLALNSR